MGRAARTAVAVLVVMSGCDREAPSTVETGTAAGPEVLERITRPVEGANVHLVRLIQRGDQYAFEPAVVRVVPGDVVRFVMVGSQPESVAFEEAGASPEAAAYIRSNSLHLGVLLTDNGQAYDVSFADAPPGHYPFVSVPHTIHGMLGEVLVAE